MQNLKETVKEFNAPVESQKWEDALTDFTMRILYR